MLYLMTGLIFVYTFNIVLGGRGTKLHLRSKSIGTNSNYGVVLDSVLQRKLFQIWGLFLQVI